MAVTAAPGPREVVESALAGRKERALLAEPSAARVGEVLASRCRAPAAFVRAAFGTLGRFAAEVADGDLPGLLARGRDDVEVAEHSLARLRYRHDGCTAGQLAALSFGPMLWWTFAGVPVAWREPAGAPSPVLPMPGVARAGSEADRNVRLLMLALLGTGTTAEELLSVRVRDAGALDAAGRLLPDLEAEPLAIEYAPAEGGGTRLTFLPFEARSALRERLADRRPGPDDPLLLPPGEAAEAAAGASVRSAALIGAGNDVNVTLCRATGDFFRSWGMPGARFDARQAARSPTPTEEPT